jgi:hypothetical protein
MLTELVFKSNGDSEKLRKMLAAPYHICGVHNDENYPCTDDCPYKKLSNPPRGKLDLNNPKHLEKFETLKKTFHAYFKLATKYAPQCRNNICESMQRSFTVDVDKNLDYSATYSERADVTVNRKINGEKWVVPLLQELGISIPEVVSDYLENIDKQKQKEKNKKSTLEARLRKQELKKKLRKKHNKDTIEG